MATQAFIQTANAAFVALAQFDAGINTILPAARMQIINNIYDLWHMHAKGPLYQNFFAEIQTTLGQVPANQIPNHKLRVSAVFISKLTAPYVNDNSLGGYIGGASEIIDTVRTLGRPAGVPTCVSVPQGNKTYEAVDWVPLNANQQQPQALEQDIDRTEVHGNTKYYVEIKADSETAIHKISSKGTTQLEGILSVIRNRTRRQQLAVQGQLGQAPVNFNSNGRALLPGISITNPGGWLQLFTSGVITLYTARNFHLLIDNQIIVPNDLNQVHAELWALVGLQGPPLNYYQLRMTQNRQSQLTMNNLFSHRGVAFPTATVLAGAQFHINGLVVAPPPLPPPGNQAIPPAPAPPP